MEDPVPRVWGEGCAQKSSDEEILEWCYANGRRPGEGEVEIFNGFMQKAGWRDASSERLAMLIRRSGLEHLHHRCATRFDFIEFDEGRTPPDFRRWEPPAQAV